MVKDYTEPNEQREECQDFLGHSRVVSEEAAWQIWQLKDSITTVVEANHYGIWDLSQTDYGFVLLWIWKKIF